MKLPWFVASSSHGCLCVTVFHLPLSLALSHCGPAHCHHSQSTALATHSLLSRLSTNGLQDLCFLSFNWPPNCAVPTSSHFVPSFHRLRHHPKPILSSLFQTLSGNWALLLKDVSGCQSSVYTKGKHVSSLTLGILCNYHIISSWMPSLISTYKTCIA